MFAYNFDTYTTDIAQLFHDFNLKMDQAWFNMCGSSESANMVFVCNMKYELG